MRPVRELRRPSGSGATLWRWASSGNSPFFTTQEKSIQGGNQMKSIRTIFGVLLLTVVAACGAAPSGTEAEQQAGTPHDETPGSTSSAIKDDSNQGGTSNAIWQCKDGICCAGLRCCAWSPDLGWVCQG